VETTPIAHEAGASGPKIAEAIARAGRGCRRCTFLKFIKTPLLKTKGIQRSSSSQSLTFVLNSRFFFDSRKRWLDWQKSCLRQERIEVSFFSIHKGDPGRRQWNTALHPLDAMSSWGIAAAVS
jgi:hypothetical protein